MNKNNYLCYTRNSYNLSFYNYNAYVTGKDRSVQFEAPLSGYDFKPEYPANLEKNAYVFDGWYTTAGCYGGSEADLSTMTMPASDVILYAKWTPKTHTVKTYLTKDVMDNGGTELDIWTEVPHGTTVEEPDAPTNGAYTFVGWFYISDSGEEKAFDFSMPVNRDLNLYAKWSSNTLVTYTVKYAVENSDGTLTYIADDTTGSALAGTTKTFDAKTGTELKEDYRSGYFPKVSSHSLTMDIDGGVKNVFTFMYVAKPEVTYTVKYLEKGTEKQLADPKTVTTRDAVVTEPFKQIAGYAPDAYQKQLVLAAEGNVITFWYVRDEVHAPVRVVHWIQNIAGDGYTEYRSSTNLNGVIGNTYSETPLEIPGFQFNGTRSNASGKLDAGGLLLELYYDRIEYPYVFRFIDQATGKEIAESEGGKARYQAQVTQTAKDIPGYKLVGTETQAINIAIEDPDHVAGKNVKIFYYTEETVSIQYKVVGPTGCGTLDNYQENNLKVLTGTAAGSNPTAVNGYKFVGWYTDEACTRSVDTAWIANDRLTPQKTKPLGSEMGYEAATYYAKFELDVFDLTIRKVGCAEIDENQGFLFRITGPNGFSIEVTVHGNGSKTIQGLQMGEYTVTEVESWSWRYQCQNNNQVVKSENVTDGEASVTFTNKRDFIFWLNGCAFADNRWRREKA
ncbi:MAG: InlB B-repeat-containing protein [Candidatus Faecousia sp.]|nr:InlB B-repeat-containing protein [Candidatus Faecousia sp.]